MINHVDMTILNGVVQAIHAIRVSGVSLAQQTNAQLDNIERMVIAMI